MGSDEHDTSIVASRPRRLATAFDRICFHCGYAVLAGVVLVCLVELLSMVVVGVYHGAYARLSVVAPGIAPRETDHRLFSLRNRIMDDVRRASGVYAGQPWAEAFLAETGDVQSAWRNRYEPFRVWGNVEIHGTYINVDAGPTGIWRRTIGACAGQQADPVRVWALGASVIVGADTPDFATIPSYLSQALHAAGRRCVDVTNMGVMGYVVNQDAILLTELLKAGHRPDIVMVLSGANEVEVGALSPGLASAHGGLLDIKSRVENPVHVQGLLDASYAFRLTRAVVSRVAPPAFVALTERGDTVPLDTSGGALAVKVRQTLDNYEANISLVQALGRTYGFSAYFFWQPIIYVGRSNPSAFERMLIEHPALNDPDENRAIEMVYREAERRAGTSAEFVFLGRIFDRVDGPIYVDGVHLGPRGNEIMAGAMAASLDR